MSREDGGRKSRIAASFGAAAEYERSAEVQARIAQSLAAMLPPDPFGAGESEREELSQSGRGAGDGEKPSRRRGPPLVLEVGCGTGLLGRALIGRLPPTSRIAFTDISPDMVRRARRGLAKAFPAAAFAAMDAEAVAVRPVFDLVVSSMALQWTSDLGAALRGLAGLLRPGGRMLVALPGRESFARWREACRRLGLPYGGPIPPSAGELAALLPKQGATEVREERLCVRHADALAFFRSLKAIGAGVPSRGYAPMGAADFKRLLRAMDEGSGRGEPFEMDYQALYALHVKADRQGESEEES